MVILLSRFNEFVIDNVLKVGDSLDREAVLGGFLVDLLEVNTVRTLDFGLTLGDLGLAGRAQLN